MKNKNKSSKDKQKKKSLPRSVLIYDGKCPVCQKTMGWIKENARRGAFEMIPCQSDAVKERFPFIEEATCMRAIQLILPDGKVLSGEKAMPEILKRLKRYSSAAEIFRLPGSDILSRAFYNWFADKRYHIAKVLFPDKDKKRKDKKT